MPPKKKTVSPSKVKRKAKDWRGGTLNMVDLVWNLHDKPEGQSMADVTFLLSDGTELKAHKLILATIVIFLRKLSHTSNQGLTFLSSAFLLFPTPLVSSLAQ